MKLIHLILFFTYLIPIIFNSSTDGYTITVESSIYGIECTLPSDNMYRIQFSFNAFTSGFNEQLGFNLKLHYPDYAIAECYAPPSTEGQKDTITCYINVVNFPLWDTNVYQLPSQSEINSIIDISNWDTYIGQASIKTDGCQMPYKYTFTKNKEPFYVEIDGTTGYRYLFGKGSFDGDTIAKQNYLTETDPICILSTTYIFVDNDFYYNQCEIYSPDETINSGDYEIHCTIKGEKKAVFFPTLSYSQTDQGYVRLDIYEEVYLSGTLAKISGLLLLSLLLL